MRRSKKCGNAGSGEVEPISQGLYKTCIESSFKLKRGLASCLWWGAGLGPTPWWHDNLFHTLAVLGASLNGLGWPLVWCPTVPARSSTLSPFDDIFCVISKGSDYLKGALAVVHISQYIWASWIEIWKQLFVCLKQWLSRVVSRGWCIIRSQFTLSTGGDWHTVTSIRNVFRCILFPMSVLFVVFPDLFFHPV